MAQLRHGDGIPVYEFTESIDRLDLSVLCVKDHRSGRTSALVRIARKRKGFEISSSL